MLKCKQKLEIIIGIGIIVFIIIVFGVFAKRNTMNINIVNNGCVVTENISGEYLIESENDKVDSNVKIVINCSKLNKNAFYEAEVMVQADDYENVRLCGAESDINGTRVYTKPASQNWEKLTRVVEADDKGNIDFALQIGNEEDCFDGKAKVKGIKLKAINNKEYQILENSRKSIRIILKKEDCLNIDKEEILKWLDVLAEIKDALEELTGKQYDMISYVATEEFEHYGLAGNPVYINRQYMTKDMEKINENITKEKEEKNILWGYVHEMCHVYDGAADKELASWIFDSELSAQLETAYVLNKTGYGYGDNKSVYDHFEGSIPLESGVYSDEGFLDILLKFMKQHDLNMKSLEEVIKSDKFDDITTIKEKFMLFIEILAKNTGVDLREEISEKEWQVLEYKYVKYKVG